jgi:molybdenum cofactor cytidylyltransferase
VIAGLVLAAGPGSRFPGIKQLATLGDRPLLEWAAAAMANARRVDRFAVVLGACADEIVGRVDLHNGQPVVCDRWQEGIGASLRTGLAVFGGAEAVVITLADQPLVTAEAIDRVATRRNPILFDVVRATYRGIPSHPVVLERRALARSGELAADVGARALFPGLRVLGVVCDSVAEPQDVDTRRDLEAVAAILARSTSSDSSGSRPSFGLPVPRQR